MIGVEVDETGVVKVISPQLSACFSTHILIDGYDIPKRPGRAPPVWSSRTSRCPDRPCGGHGWAASTRAQTRRVDGLDGVVHRGHGRHPAGLHRCTVTYVQVVAVRQGPVGVSAQDALRRLAAVTAAAAVSGLLVGGVGSRLAMMLLAAMSPQAT